MKVRLTKKTRNFGWGWRCWTLEHPEGPESPQIIGTIGTVRDQIEQDRTYQSIRQNTFYTTCWFVRDTSGKWYPLKQKVFDYIVLGLYDCKYKEVFVNVP